MQRKIISFILSFLLLFQQAGLVQAATELNLTGIIGQMRSNVFPDKFRPLHLRYFSYDTANDSFRLLVDKGDLKNIAGKQLTDSTQGLLKYFLTGVTLPNDAFWVNLRPDSGNEVIDARLSRTDIGKVLLEADLQLKKDTAQLTSPQAPEGKQYWQMLYKKAYEVYGSENVDIPTLTRPWIVPDEVIIRQAKDSAYIYKATLKVMLEDDFLKGSKTYNFTDPRAKALNEYSSQLIRELIIPKLTIQVNSAKRYAPLRQVFYSLVLARWFKAKFAGTQGQYVSLIDRGNLDNLTAVTAYSADTYYKEYQKSFAKGEYNLSEIVPSATGRNIRSYFSGGMMLDFDIASSSVVSSVLGSRVIPKAFGSFTVETQGADALLSALSKNGSQIYDGSTSSPVLKLVTALPPAAAPASMFTKKTATASLVTHMLINNMYREETRDGAKVGIFNARYVKLGKENGNIVVAVPLELKEFVQQKLDQAKKDQDVTGQVKIAQFAGGEELILEIGAPLGKGIDIETIGKSIMAAATKEVANGSFAGSPIVDIPKIQEKIAELKEIINELGGDIKRIERNTDSNKKEINNSQAQLSTMPPFTHAGILNNIRELRTQNQRNSDAIGRIQDHISKATSDLRDLENKVISAGSPVQYLNDSQIVRLGKILKALQKARDVLNKGQLSQYELLRDLFEKIQDVLELPTNIVFLSQVEEAYDLLKKTIVSLGKGSNNGLLGRVISDLKNTEESLGKLISEAKENPAASLQGEIDKKKQELEGLKKQSESASADHARLLGLAQLPDATLGDYWSGKALEAAKLVGILGGKIEVMRDEIGKMEAKQAAGSPVRFKDITKGVLSGEERLKNGDSIYEHAKLYYTIVDENTTHPDRGKKSVTSFWITRLKAPDGKLPVENPVTEGDLIAKIKTEGMQVLRVIDTPKKVSAGSPVTVADIFTKAQYRNGIDALRVLVRIAKIYGGSISLEMRGWLAAMATSVDETARKLASEATGALRDPNNKTMVPLTYWLTDEELFKEAKENKNIAALHDLVNRAKRDPGSFSKDPEMRGWLASMATAVDNEIRKLALEATDALRNSAGSPIQVENNKDKLQALLKKTNSDILSILEDINRLSWGFMLKFESKLPNLLTPEIIKGLLRSLGLAPDNSLSSQSVVGYSSPKDLDTAIAKATALHAFFKDRFERLSKFLDDNKAYINNLPFAQSAIFVDAFKTVARGYQKSNKIKQDLEAFKAAGSPIDIEKQKKFFATMINESLSKLAERITNDMAPVSDTSYLTREIYRFALVISGQKGEEWYIEQNMKKGNQDVLERRSRDIKNLENAFSALRSIYLKQDVDKNIKVLMDLADKKAWDDVDNAAIGIAIYRLGLILMDKDPQAQIEGILRLILSGDREGLKKDLFGKTIPRDKIPEEWAVLPYILYNLALALTGKEPVKSPFELKMLGITQHLKAALRTQLAFDLPEIIEIVQYSRELKNLKPTPTSGSPVIGADKVVIELPINKWSASEDQYGFGPGSTETNPIPQGFLEELKKKFSGQVIIDSSIFDSTDSGNEYGPWEGSYKTKTTLIIPQGIVNSVKEVIRKYYPTTTLSISSVIHLNETDISAFRMKISNAAKNNQAVPLDELIGMLPQNSALRSALTSLKQIQGKPTNADMQWIIKENNLNDAEQVALTLLAQPGQRSENVAKFVTLMVNKDLQGLNFRDVERAIASGKMAIAEVSVDWAKKIKETYPNDVYTIFISPLSEEQIRGRMQEKGQTRQEVIFEEMAGRQRERAPEKPTNEEKQLTRAQAAVAEMSRQNEYDTVIVSNVLKDLERDNSRWASEEGAKVVAQFMGAVDNARKSGKKLILYSGPSATGKSPLWNQVQQKYEDQFSRIVLYTTRDPRPGEKDKVDFHFKSVQQLKDLEKEGTVSAGSPINIDDPRLKLTVLEKAELLTKAIQNSVRIVYGRTTVDYIAPFVEVFLKDFGRSPTTDETIEFFKIIEHEIKLYTLSEAYWPEGRKYAERKAQEFVNQKIFNLPSIISKRLLKDKSKFQTVIANPLIEWLEDLRNSISGKDFSNRDAIKAIKYLSYYLSGVVNGKYLAFNEGNIGELYDRGIFSKDMEKRGDYELSRDKEGFNDKENELIFVRFTLPFIKKIVSDVLSAAKENPKELRAILSALEGSISDISAAGSPVEKKETLDSLNAQLKELNTNAYYAFANLAKEQREKIESLAQTASAHVQGEHGDSTKVRQTYKKMLQAIEDEFTRRERKLREGIARDRQAIEGKIKLLQPAHLESLIQSNPAVGFPVGLSGDASAKPRVDVLSVSALKPSINRANGRIEITYVLPIEALDYSGVVPSLRDAFVKGLAETMERHGLNGFELSFQEDSLILTFYGAVAQTHKGWVNGITNTVKSILASSPVKSSVQQLGAGFRVVYELPNNYLDHATGGIIAGIRDAVVAQLPKIREKYGMNSGISSSFQGRYIDLTFNKKVSQGDQDKIVKMIEEAIKSAAGSLPEQASKGVGSLSQDIKELGDKIKEIQRGMSANDKTIGELKKRHTYAELFQKSGIQDDINKLTEENKASYKQLSQIRKRLIQMSAMQRGSGRIVRSAGSPLGAGGLSEKMQIALESINESAPKRGDTRYMILGLGKFADIFVSGNAQKNMAEINSLMSEQWKNADNKYFVEALGYLAALYAKTGTPEKNIERISHIDGIAGASLTEAFLPIARIINGADAHEQTNFISRMRLPYEERGDKDTVQLLTALQAFAHSFTDYRAGALLDHADRLMENARWRDPANRQLAKAIIATGKIISEARNREGIQSSSSVSKEETAPVSKPGGIDLRITNIITQTLGSFSGLNFALPKIANLNRTDLDSEYQQIQRMVDSGIVPSGERIKEYVALCCSSGKMNVHMDELLLCLADICKLQEDEAKPMSPDLKEALVIVDAYSSAAPL